MGVIVSPARPSCVPIGPLTTLGSCLPTPRHIPIPSSLLVRQYGKSWEIRALRPSGRFVASLPTVLSSGLLHDPSLGCNKSANSRLFTSHVQPNSQVWRVRDIKPCTAHDNVEIVLMPTICDQPRLAKGRNTFPDGGYIWLYECFNETLRGLCNTVSIWSH